MYVTMFVRVYIRAYVYICAHTRIYIHIALIVYGEEEFSL